MLSAMSRRALLATSVALALTVTACGGGSKSSSAGTTSSSDSAASDTAATDTTVPSGPPTNVFHPGTVPAVDNASNVKLQPVPHAGKGSPPTQLTGADLVVGTGTVAGLSNTVLVNYVGFLYQTGTVFDASWTRGQPAMFPLNGVVPGFAQGIEGMRIGGRREIVIPPDLGYGSAGSPIQPGQPQAVPPNSTIVFVVDLLQVQ